MKIGDWIKIKSYGFPEDAYMIAQVAPAECLLIGIDGNRYIDEPMKCNPMDIREIEIEVYLQKHCNPDETIYCGQTNLRKWVL
jgi:hypothetical protein